MRQVAVARAVRANQIGSGLASISDEKLDELRERVDLAAVVQRRVPLKKSGRDWKGLCPFHGEKTPSFYVVPDKRLFHCFGCGATGDAIKFVMQAEGRSFREACEQLAAEVGVTLTPTDPEEARRSAHRAALAEVNEKACAFFERLLWEHPLGAPARTHLADRGVDRETARVWRLGYAPNRWDALCLSLAKSKVDPQLVEQAGLGVPRKKGDGLYDRFRGRLTIPIREAARIVAFGGRLIEGESEAKYLNSPETPLYEKSRVLFALDRARDAIRKEGVALFVEGYFDAIGLHQSGVTSAVATCGTSLTERHLELVQRAGAKEVVFVFDGDGAGLRAAQRASEIAASKSVPARVLVPPDGEDPDETVRRLGTEGFRALLKTAKPALEFLIDRALAALGPDAAHASVEARVAAVESVRGLVAAAPGELARTLYIEKISEILGAPVGAVRAALNEKRPRADTRADARSAPRPADRPSPASGQVRSLPARGPVEGARSGRPARAEGRLNRPAVPLKPVSPPAPKLPPAPRLAAKAELQLAAHLLAWPSHLPLLAEAGGPARFTVPGLRLLLEGALSAQAQGGLDAAALTAQVDPPALREALQRAQAELSSIETDGSAEQRWVRNALRRHAQLAAEEEVTQRKAARARKVPPGA